MNISVPKFTSFLVKVTFKSKISTKTSVEKFFDSKFTPKMLKSKKRSTTMAKSMDFTSTKLSKFVPHMEITFLLPSKISISEIKQLKWAEKRMTIFADMDQFLFLPDKDQSTK